MTISTATPLDLAKARRQVDEDEARHRAAARHRRSRRNLEYALVRTAGLLGMRITYEALRDRTFLQVQTMLRDAEQALTERRAS